MNGYPNVTDIMYSQEEPRNCGAWSFVNPRLANVTGQKVLYSGRPEMPTRNQFYTKVLLTIFVKSLLIMMLMHES